MTYFIYFLFVIWILSGIGGLLAGALTAFGPANAPKVSPRPAWFHFSSAVYTLAVAGILISLYNAGTINEWWVLIIGTVILIPELLFFVVSKLGSRG